MLPWSIVTLSKRVSTTNENHSPVFLNLIFSSSLYWQFFFYYMLCKANFVLKCTKLTISPISIGDFMKFYNQCGQKCFANSKNQNEYRLINWSHHRLGLLEIFWTLLLKIYRFFLCIIEGFHESKRSLVRITSDTNFSKEFWLFAFTKT